MKLPHYSGPPISIKLNGGKWDGSSLFVSFSGKQRRELPLAITIDGTLYRVKEKETVTYTAELAQTTPEEVR